MDGGLTRRTYICDKCGEFETTTSIKEEPLKKCKCGMELKRRFEFPDVLFCEVNKNRWNPINPQKEFPILK